MKKSRPLPSGPARSRRPTYLQWLPWEKMTIWGLFLLAVYTLRSFFFIIFMTFILSYIMRGVIVRITRILSPQKERAWLERILTVLCFALLLFGLYGLGLYLGPPLKAQTNALVGRLTNFDPQREFDNLLTKTVGVYLQERHYSDPQDPRYQEEFRTFVGEGPRRVRVYQDFPVLEAQIEGAFEREEREAIRAALGSARESKEFDAWFLETKAPEIYARDRERYIQQWEDGLRRASALLSEPVEALKEKYAATRDESILHQILEEAKAEPQKLAGFEEEWKEAQVAKQLEAWRHSEEYMERFRKYYETNRKAAPASYPYPFEKYLELRDAYPRGEVAFTEALGEETDGLSEEERARRQRVDFEAYLQAKLARAWWRGEGEAGPGGLAAQIRSTLLSYANEAFSTMARWVPNAIKYLITLPVQLVLSLLLSLFITFDMPKLRRGIRQLRQSRVRDFYEEIAPGLYSFGQLIGRAFQAQGVIALFNTLLTFVAIKYLEIQNEMFLCAVVFLCSFIPVLGVVLSSVPIAVMAIIQPGGSLWLAIQAVIAVLLIHFLETSVLNPKILGDMLHLHPVLVLAILAVGQHFFGVWGLLLGVPVMVYIIRFVILDEGIPGILQPEAAAAAMEAQGQPPTGGEAEGVVPPRERPGPVRRGAPPALTPPPMDSASREDGPARAEESAAGEACPPEATAAPAGRSGAAAPPERRGRRP